MSKVKVTDFKTKRINALTGGKIQDYEIPDYPKSKSRDGELSNSFIAPDGTYLGNYGRAWWYVKNNMVVCREYPHGVGIIFKKPVKEYKLLDSFLETGEVHPKAIKGYYGFSHRGGQTFKIGDRLFKENYEPKKKNYTEKEWAKFEKEHEAYIKREVKSGWYDSIEDARKNCDIADIIPFTMRGTKIIETWKEALQSAINMSNYLS